MLVKGYWLRELNDRRLMLVKGHCLRRLNDRRFKYGVCCGVRVVPGRIDVLLAVGRERQCRKHRAKQ